MSDEPPPPTEENNDAELTFESALAQIETIVKELERGTLELDTALTRYERGVRLLSHCQSKLQAAERRVGLLTGTDDNGNPETEPFTGPSASGSENGTDS